jgi:hypothetical protein
LSRDEAAESLSSLDADFISISPEELEVMGFLEDFSLTDSETLEPPLEKEFKCGAAERTSDDQRGQRRTSEYCKPGAPSMPRHERTALLSTAVQETLNLLDKVFPDAIGGVALRRTKALELIAAGISATSRTFTEDDALHWADNFDFSEAGLAADLEMFLAADRDLKAMAVARLEQLASSRFSRDRVERHLSPENPEWDRMIKLAGEGMPVPLGPEFVPNSTAGALPPLRQTYVRLNSVVNRLLEESFHEKGLAFILPKEQALCVEGLHLSVNSWVPKQGKEHGRPIGDCSDAGRGQTPLNSKAAKLLSDRLWGKIVHPSLEDLVRQITEFFAAAQEVDKDVVWEDVVLFKMDLAGAYTLISFSPDDVKLMGFELTKDRIMFMLCGIFGWGGTPAAFQVITRACVFELSRTILGRILMYVDDLLGVCLRKNLPTNLAKASTFLTNLLGPAAVAVHKTESGRRLTEIGYTIDLNERLVEISDRNVAKSLIGYLEAVPGGRTTRREMERLASWASRYGAICMYIRPFNRLLYNSYLGHGTAGTFTLREEEMRAVRMVRLLLVMTALEPCAFCRSLESFEMRAATVIIEFDASLQGIGLIWYAIDPLGEEHPLGGLSVDISAMGFEEDSQFQNTAEFIAATLGLLGIIYLGLEGSVVKMRGDSISALCWSTSLRFKGCRTANAAVVFTLLLIQTKTTIVGFEFLTSEENVRTDKLSRGESVAAVSREFSNLSGLSELFFPESIAQTLTDCHPQLELSDDAAFSELWRRVLNTRMTLLDERESNETTY